VTCGRGAPLRPVLARGEVAARSLLFADRVRIVITACRIRPGLQFAEEYRGKARGSPRIRT